MEDKPRSLIGTILIGVFVIGGFGFGAYQCAKETVDQIGDIGMNRGGRQVYCQTMDSMEKGSPNFHFRCEGFFKTINGVLNRLYKNL